MLIYPWKNTFYTLVNNERLQLLMVLCSLLTLVGVVAFVFACVFFVTHLEFASAWLGIGTSIAGTVLAMTLGWFLYPALLPLIASLMEEKTLKLTHNTLTNPPPYLGAAFWPSLWQDIKFCAIALGLNVLCVPLYFIPILNGLIYFTLNGYLFSKGFFTLVERQYTPSTAQSHYAKNRLVLFSHGVVLAVLATVPIISFFVPFIGLILMSNVFAAIAQKTTKRHKTHHA